MGNMRLIPTVDSLVVSLCADYERRKAAIESHELVRRTDTELRYLNYKIFDAAAEVVGASLSEIFIKEIGAHTGYANTKAAELSELTYKKYKKRVKRTIAEKLHLI